ncbi:MAG TPA: hypothetical protein VFS24_07555 [Steroidobacteraceae bacterium]|nr:hypothetical protein [Steroidobacteraceae bacterium]
MKLRSMIAASAATMLAGCAATTTMSSAHPEASVAVRSSKKVAAPRTESFSSTSFGNYEFRVDAPGQEPFYGVLPLRFNGGHLALDILFFAPAMFFNLREVYPYYEFDVEHRVVKYRVHKNDGWTTYSPSESEVARAQKALQTM